MKEKLLLLIVLFFGLVGLVKAQTCEVISGSGKAIGDEVICGTESFYVVGRDEEKTHLLAKYNLYVGDNISFIEADDNAPVKQSGSWSYNPYDYCGDLAVENGYEAGSFDVYPMGKDDNNSDRITGCRVYDHIRVELVLQNKKALGTFLVNGKSQLPLYGITYMYDTHGFDENGNLIYNNMPYYDIFASYGIELQGQGITVEGVSFFTLGKFLDVLEEISGKEVDVNLTFPDENISENEHIRLGKMDVKEYISEKYNWLYSTTYWLGSGYTSNSSGHTEFFDYYVSNEGFLCALGREFCYYLPYAIGNGVRPVVTLANSNINYSYKFIEGMGQDFNVVSNTNMRFRLNMEYEDFKKSGKLFIDDKEVSKACYKLSKGSTVITFVDDCCKEYSLGKHSLKATLNDGEYVATTDFILSTETSIVSKVKQIVENPKTSDKVALLIFAMIICGLLGLVYYKKNVLKRSSIE